MCLYNNIINLYRQYSVRVPQMEQELFTLPVFRGVHVSQSLVLCVFCRSLFVLLYFLLWPLCCLFIFDIRIPITPLVSSNSSCDYMEKFEDTKEVIRIRRLKVRQHNGQERKDKQ